jgi:hypothetical protein
MTDETEERSEYGLDQAGQILRNVEFLTPGTLINPAGDGKVWLTVKAVILPGQPKPFTDSDPFAVTVATQETINPFEFPFRSLVRAKKWDYKHDPFPARGTPLTITVYRDNFHSYIAPDKPGYGQPDRVYVNLSGHQCVVLGSEHLKLRAGQYDAEIALVNPLGYDHKWVQIKGTNVGTSINAGLQWSGEAWEDTRVEITLKDGTPVYPLDGPYTLEQQQYKIEKGIITDPATIHKHRRNFAKLRPKT